MKKLGNFIEDILVSFISVLPTIGKGFGRLIIYTLQYALNIGWLFSVSAACGYSIAWICSHNSKPAQTFTEYACYGMLIAVMSAIFVGIFFAGWMFADWIAKKWEDA